MLKKHKILFQISIIVIVSFLTITLSSCRENIITNENSLGNINEPVKFKTPESYSFEINASKITFSETDETQLNITNADIFISVSEYTSGFVSVTIIGDNLLNLYTTTFTNNGSSPSKKITNHVPEKIKVNFQNFSGKLKIRINRTIF
ncbi:MAG: hypothetical protein COW08_06295 [Ignavibacteriales bacterium CG12_big_fil_rev_8_21_14_0_65_30_8]|nr:MAG: hypothetical protein COW08_06295 [Ignavibacteriales bacterium CG12_big_fil_rev_8_21_14_0_65_30_8]